MNDMFILLYTEADVHTATPSLSNAAATWAGWAVTAVTAKFYRSHSDTARVSHTKSVLSKPGSLGKFWFKDLELNPVLIEIPI